MSKGVEDEAIIARIPRDASTELIIKTFTYWRVKVLDIRWHNNGKPTIKGVRCNMDEAKPLLKALQKAVGDTNENEQKLNED